MVRYFANMKRTLLSIFGQLLLITAVSQTDPMDASTILIDLNIREYEPEQVRFEIVSHDVTYIYTPEIIHDSQVLIRIPVSYPVIGRLVIDKTGLELFLMPGFDVQIIATVTGWGDHIKQAVFQGPLKHIQELLYRQRRHFYPTGRIRPDIQVTPLNYRAPNSLPENRLPPENAPLYKESPKEALDSFLTIMEARYKLLEWNIETRAITPNTPPDEIVPPLWADSALHIIQEFPFLSESGFLSAKLSLIDFKRRHSDKLCTELFDIDEEVMNQKIINQLTARIKKLKLGAVFDDSEYMEITSCLSLLTDQLEVEKYKADIKDLLTMPPFAPVGFVWEDIFHADGYPFDLKMINTRFLALVGYDRTTELDKTLQSINGLALYNLTIGTLSLDYLKENWDNRIQQLPEQMIHLWAEKGIANKLAIGLQWYEFPRTVIFDLEHQRVIYDSFPASALEKYWPYIVAIQGE
jgi:hypothetical protein